MSAERGVIRNRQHATQIRDFSGMRFGNITPTDIDGFMEFGDRTFIFMESKFGNSELLLGQRLALERLCDACHAAGKASLLLVLQHHTIGDIAFASTQVTRYRYARRWHQPACLLTAFVACSAFKWLVDASGATNPSHGDLQQAFSSRANSSQKEHP